MAFIDQVQDLTSLSASDTDELSQFLKDGVLDVTNRWLAIRPQDLELFGRESSETTSNASLNLNSARIISVIREDGTNNQWRNCRKISPALQYDVTDVDSLNYASKINPAYMIGDAGKISVFPIPGADPNAFKAYYVNKDPVNSSGSALIHSHDDILYFPIDKVYLVIMYAGIRSLHAAMGATTITDLTVTVVPPDVPLLASTSISFSQAAPTYTKPSITTRVSFEDFFNTIEDGNPFGDSDPGALTISVSAPSTPSDPTISYSNASVGDAVSVAQDSIAAAVDSIVAGPSDASGTSDTDAPSDASGDGSSAYVTPTITTGTGLTVMDAVSGEETPLGVDADYDNWGQWFNVLGELIEDEEDSELAQAQIGKIQTFIQAFQAEVQDASALMQATIQDAQLATQASIANASNDVATNNASMQTLIQASVANAQNDVNASIAKMQHSTTAATQKMAQSTTAAIQKMQLSSNINLQNAAKTLEASIQDYGQEIALFQGEIAKYQAQVNDEVQEKAQNLQRYTTELTTAFQAWGKTESDSLQQYTADIQNELNEFNDANIEYQAQLQVSIQNAQLENQDEQFKVQKYQAEYAGYTAEVNEQVQAYTQNLQADGIGYQWLQDQYNRLKAEYDAAFMIAAPKQQAPQPQQRAR